VLTSLFFRNKGCYIVGKLINGFNEYPFALPILHTRAAAAARSVDGRNADGDTAEATHAHTSRLVIDAVLFGEDDLLMLFSFARAYFMVDMEIPSAYVQFLRSMMPRKPRNEIYNALGLAKQGKTLFYRDFLHHLRHSSDKFRIAPGIKGMVMLVFDLPSFSLCFQGHQGLLPAAKRHHPRADQGQVPAGQAARPGRAHGRYAGVQRGGLSA
jgi:isocitrate dehydrogenase kinase/phosphatase